MDLAFSPDDRAFQREVQDFLKDKLPARLRQVGRFTPGAFAPLTEALAWQKTLYERGWLAYAWPKELGGTGWTPVRRYIFERECALAHAPAIPPQGLRMLAPVLGRFGSEEQKSFYLPRILSGNDVWCQGYSEPDAGSDLASLACRAVCQGDHYLVNGTKIWTTNAHLSNRMFCLVRTDPDTKPQKGISFLLIDMTAPGISVRPIRLISGDSELNQVFFDDVRVPVADRVGAENDGWTIAKYLLEYERGGSCLAPGLLAALADLRAATTTIPGRDGEVLARDRDFMHRLAMVEWQAQGMEICELKLLFEMVGGASPGPQTAVIGLLMAEIRQSIDRLLVEAQGVAGIELTTERPVDDFNRLAMPSYLNNRAWSIMAGTNEIMRTLIARSVLGL